ncbi:MAG: AtpZ/AtpI family protein [bacterium]|nr:AtpZ/AtpI family protein [bacterium]
MLDRESVRSLAIVAEYSALGIQLLAMIAVFALLGWWLDSLWNTKPYLLMIGALLGSVAGIYNFIRAVQKLNQKLEKKEKEKINQTETQK